MQFEFATAGRIVFGQGRLAEALSGAHRFGNRALVVTGKDPARPGVLLERLRELGIEAVSMAVDGEPSVDSVLGGVALGREHAAEFLVGFGGGSALDTAKAVAALLANTGNPLDYLEVVGRGQPLSKPALSCVAIPTTAGTGSEVTKNAVLASQRHQVKVSLRDASMLPRLAIVDSELTLSMPRALTAATGLDALTQCIEPYLSCMANPLTDGLAREGMTRGARGLKRAYLDGMDLEARDDMALCSLFGGLALANAKLGAVHGFAGPVGGMTQAPHGAICARLLPLVFAANARALRQRAPSHPALARMSEVACILTGEPGASPDRAVLWLEALVAELEIPGLSQYGLGHQHLEVLVSKAQRASSMRGNPIELSEAELGQIAEQALAPPGG